MHIFFRIGTMGEHSAMKSIMDVMKNHSSIGLGVIGIKFIKNLGQPLIDIKNHAEIDIMNMYCNGNNITIIFGECKVLQSLKSTTPEQLKKKVKDSLDQAERDMSLFFAINPDLTTENLEKIKFITLVRFIYLPFLCKKL